MHVRKLSHPTYGGQGESAAIDSRRVNFHGLNQRPQHPSCQSLFQPRPKVDDLVGLSPYRRRGRLPKASNTTATTVRTRTTATKMIPTHMRITPFGWSRVRPGYQASAPAADGMIRPCASRARARPAPPPPIGMCVRPDSGMSVRQPAGADSPSGPGASTAGRGTTAAFPLVSVPLGLLGRRTEVRPLAPSA